MAADDRETIIYALCDPETGEIRYIGKTVNIKARHWGHSHGAKHRKTHRDRWVRSVVESGSEPIIAILEIVPAGDDWERKERWWIAYYRQRGTRLTNHTDGGEGTHGWKHSAETREKISNANSGKIHSDETKAKISEVQKGKKLTEEHKAKVSLALTGRPVSEETRAKIGASHRGMVRSPESRAKMSASQTGLKRPNRPPISDETRRRQSKSHMGQHPSEETRSKRSESMKMVWKERKADQKQQVVEGIDL